MTKRRELWLDVPGFEGRYQASDRGNVRSLMSAHGTPWRGGPRPVAQHRSGGRIEYAMVKLWRNNRRVAHLVHRLVLFTFEGPPPPGCTDGAHGFNGHYDNSIQNLRWASHVDNVRESTRWTAMDCLLGIPPPPAIPDNSDELEVPCPF